MISRYVNLYFPLCSLVVNVILTILFFSKRKIKNIDNSIYSKLLICGLTESIFMFSTNLLVCICYLPQYYFIFKILNKVLYSIYIAWLSILFVYIYRISDTNKNELKQSILIVINIILIVVIFCSPIELYYENGLTNSYGAAANVLYFGCTLYLIAMLIITALNFKKHEYKKKYIPFIILIVLMSAMMIIRLVDPLFNLSSNVFSLVLFVMYFTIENPDMKLLTELHKSKEVSDSANEEKTLFIYNMTQEIRTITGKIDDDADLILSSKDWEETYDTARDIKSNTSKFTNITNDILDISQIDSSTIKVYNNKYNIKNILKQVVNIYSDLCKNKEIKFRTNIDHNIPEELYGDGINLKEALTNILNNSVKYTEKGYIELNVNTIIKNDVCRLIITIEDSGIGIKSEEINNIKVSDNSLSKTNKLITVMNGAMLISSEYGIGTKIKIILDQKMEVSKDIEVKKYNDELDDIKVLAVDDSEAGLKIIEKLLKGTKINLTKATTGKECINNVKANKYDLILLDEELSQITANELIVKLKEIRNFKTPVVLLTKDNSYEYNEEYLKQGFIGYMLKPLKKDIFINEINKYSNNN